MSDPPTPYVEYGSLATAPAPLRCKGTDLHMFLLDGSYADLFRLCHRVFTVPTRGKVIAVPVAGRVLVSFGRIASIVAGGDYAGRGWVEERQVATWVPALFVSEVKRFIGLFVVNMWLDNPISVASGREQFGYPKSWGWANFPDEENDRRTGVRRPTDARGYTLEVPALATHAPKTPLAEHVLLRLDPPAGGARQGRALGNGWGEVSATMFDGLLESAENESGPRDTPELDDDGSLLLPPAPDPELAAGAISPLEGADGLSVDLGEGLVRIAAWLFDRATDFAPPVNQTFLRQFRSPANGALASELNAVQAPATVVDVHSARLIEKHGVHVADLASHPLRAELGIGSRAGESRRGVEVRFDFNVDNGIVLG